MSELFGYYPMTGLRLSWLRTVILFAFTAILFGGLVLVYPAFEQRSSKLDLLIVADRDSLTRDQPIRLSVVDSQTKHPLQPTVKCRWVYQHTDLGAKGNSDGSCVLTLFVDPQRTRLSRFEHDAAMQVDVIVKRQGEQVGFVSTKVTFIP